MDSALRTQCWIEYDAEHIFPLENIPFGAYEVSEGVIHGCTRIGDHIIDLHELKDNFSAQIQNLFEGDLTKFMGMGKEYRIEVRNKLQEIFTNADKKGSVNLRSAEEFEPKMVLPCFIRDYTDFYSSKNHAYNIGVMFRGVDNAL